APGPVVDFAGALRSDRARYAAFFHAALDRGVYFPPSPLETAFTSMAMRPEDLERIGPALRAAFRAARSRTGR
ncbi:MAG TPA: aspartate aminotransferase family protein, partial [Thermoplasmata archaeon]|nr:aspartate aminotransferase family protein [Thermoplasmata archaeon]